MQSFPFRGFQNHNNPYYTNNINNQQSEFNIFSENTNSINDTKKNNENENQTNNFFKNIPFSFNLDSIMGDNSSPVVEIMGIKLYADDILILILLFILYKEEVKDEMLYISLILLLLS